MRNGVQLITYPDSLGGDLASLGRFLNQYGTDLFTGLHILPFFPSSADRGFSPVTYESVDPVFGNWDDLERIGAKFDLTVDFMVNHLSRQSAQFQDFLRHRNESEWRRMFLRYNEFWPNGEPSSDDLSKIYTRKPRPPFLEVEFADGNREKIWCSFGYEQIDLDIRQSVTREFIGRTLRQLGERGAKMIRLDAIAYTTKKPGTNCFFLEPEIWETLGYCQRAAAVGGALVLPEIHGHYSIQQNLEKHGFWAYDFALPMLVLHTLYSGNSRRLREWLKICPRRQITTLDTHDGIGVVNVVDLLSTSEIETAKESLYRYGANVKPIYNTTNYGNLDIYQLNCTYYSALGESDTAYLIARAIQFFTPGIPQVYYVGLLAGRNDIERLERSKQGRDINRHDYTWEEIERETARPVVNELFELMRLRTNHPAFGGEFAIQKTEEDSQLDLQWTNGKDSCRLSVDLTAMKAKIAATKTNADSELPTEIQIG